MIEKQLKSVSVRARVSFGICCLEKALIHYGCTLEKWRFVVEKLWRYTNIKYLDDWYYEIAEWLPDSLLEDNIYHAEEFEYVTKEQFLFLSNLYKTESNQTINKIFRLVFETGTIDLYSKLENFAPNSLNSLEKIESIMKQNNIEMPPITSQANHSFNENNGWGERFDGTNDSMIL